MTYFSKFKEVSLNTSLLGNIAYMHKYSCVSVVTQNLKCLALAILKRWLGQI